MTKIRVAAGVLLVIAAAPVVELAWLAAVGYALWIGIQAI